MVDIHSHILPGWDDGPESIEDSMAMLEIAAKSGTTDIVATPHANSEFPFQPDVVRQKFEQVQSAASGLIRVHLGCDFHVQYDNVQDALANPTKYTVNHGAYLMVELPDMMSLPVMRDVLARLRNAGMVTVITHPERNASLRENIEELKNWVSDGAYLQITAQSLLGRFGEPARSTAIHLLKAGQVHFVASDAHGTTGRTPNLETAYRWVESKCGREIAERLFVSNPRAVIESVQLEDSDGTNSDLGVYSKKWWQIWK